MLAGVGNIYAKRGAVSSAHPPAAPGDKPHARGGGAAGARDPRVLSAAIRVGGTTLRDYVGADGMPGYFAIKLFVYERAARGLPSVSQPSVRHLNQGQRSSYYCPHCQK